MRSAKCASLKGPGRPARAPERMKTLCSVDKHLLLRLASSYWSHANISHCSVSLFINNMNAIIIIIALLKIEIPPVADVMKGLLHVLYLHYVVQSSAMRWAREARVAHYCRSLHLRTRTMYEITLKIASPISVQICNRDASQHCGHTSGC